jgi:hypothetical protein
MSSTMSAKIGSPAAAMAHLYAFHSSKEAMGAELDRLIKSNELQISPKDVLEICALLQLPPPEAVAKKSGANAYGGATTFAANQSQKPAGATAAQLDVAKLNKGESVAWGDFALGRHKPGTGYAYFTGTQAELVDLVKAHWKDRVPGHGRANLEEVVIVKVPAERFMTTTVPIAPNTKLGAELYRRRATEEPYVRVQAQGQAQPAAYASVVLYSKDTLGKNGERSTKADWELVSIIASPVENEPMDPVTMMRNMRAKAGGTQVDYTADQLLDAIEFWSKHAKVSG